MDDFATLLDSSPQTTVVENVREVLLVGDDSLVSSYIAVCEKEIRKLAYRGGASADHTTTTRSSESLLTLWQQEKNTWVLVKYLLSSRLSSSSSSSGVNNQSVGDSVSMYVDSHSHDAEDGRDGGVMLVDGSDRSIVNSYITSNATVSEYMAVTQWLEKTAPEMGPPEIRKTRSHTDREIFTCLNRGMAPTECPHVAELDPDGPHRLQKRLHPQDSAFQADFFKTLFAFVRRGSLSKAVEYCQNCNESWRAATMLGGIYYLDPNVVDGRAEVDPYETQPPIGNRNRGAWMQACYFIANDSSLDVNEKAVYAALCGNIVNVLPACESWEDVVWAYFHSLFIHLSEEHLYRFPRIKGDDFNDFLVGDAQGMNSRKVFASISRLPHDFLKRGAGDGFRRVQISLITSEIEILMEDLAKELSSLDDPASLRFMRFIIHLVLLLRCTGLLNDSTVADAIVKRYIRHLIETENYELVIIYASRMPYELQVTLMVSMLQQLEWSRSDRDKLLQRSYQAGMDVKEISHKAFQSVFSQRQTPKFLQPIDIYQDTASSTNEDDKLLTSFQWLLLERDQFTEALLMGNALFRRLLLEGKIQSLLNLETLLRGEYPLYGSTEFFETLISLHGSKFKNMMREFNFVMDLLDCVRRLRSWNDLYMKQPFITDGSRRLLSSSVADPVQWKSQLKDSTNSTEQRIRETLFNFSPGLWMEDSPAYSSDLPYGFQVDDRLEEMAVIREGYIPLLFNELSVVLSSTRDLIPGNLDKAVSIPQIIADSECSLTAVFGRKDGCPPYDPRATVRLVSVLDSVVDAYAIRSSSGYLSDF